MNASASHATMFSLPFNSQNKYDEKTNNIYFQKIKHTNVFKQLFLIEFSQTKVTNKIKSVFKI